MKLAKALAVGCLKFPLWMLIGVPIVCVGTIAALGGDERILEWTGRARFFIWLAGF